MLYVFIRAVDVYNIMFCEELPAGAGRRLLKISSVSGILHSITDKLLQGIESYPAAHYTPFHGKLACDHRNRKRQMVE